MRTISLRASRRSEDLGNGVRPCAALGLNNPIWRLGALVSLPVSIGKVMMVQRPDRSLSLEALPFMRPQRKRFQIEVATVTLARLVEWSPRGWWEHAQQGALVLRSVTGRPVGLTTGPRLPQDWRETWLLGG